MRMPQSAATIRFEDGRYIAEIGAADLGTGAWTVLPQIAADALGVPAADVDVRMGDTRCPTASVAGGSSGTNTWGSAIVVAAHAFREKFGALPAPGDEVTALHETSVMDPHAGQVVNHDLAGYHIAANADVTSVEAHWLDEYDPYVNAMGSKGIGEIGIVGTAAAVANAVHHATGVRVRDLPVTLDRVLAALP